MVSGVTKTRNIIKVRKKKIISQGWQPFKKLKFDLRNNKNPLHLRTVRKIIFSNE
jgi:hypothetical protein